MTRRLFVAIACCLALTTVSAQVAPTTYTWTGASDPTNNLWSDPENWLSARGLSGVPRPVDDVLFGSGSQLATNNDLTPGREIASVTFQTNGYSIGGNSITPNYGIVVANDVNVAVISAPLVLPYAHTLSVGNNSDLRLNGQLSGSGSLTKTGSGQAFLGGSASNTFSGMTSVTEGVLILQKTGGAIAFSGPLSIGGSGSVHLYSTTEQIPDTTSVAISNNGRFTIESSETIGSLDMTGGSRVTFGFSLILRGNVSATSSEGAFPLIQGGPQSVLMLNPPPDGSTLSREFNVSNGSSDTDLEIGVPVTNGQLVKTGGGTLMLSGTAVPESANLTLQEGTVWVTGTTAAVSVTGGGLGGTGSTGNVDVSATGRIAPGTTGPGTLSTGDLTMSGSSALDVQINGLAAGTEHDQLNVTGTVSLSGATALNLTLGYAPAGGDFVIVNNEGTDPVSGTFSGLPEGSSFNVGAARFTISYAGGTGNDIVLSQVPSISVSDVTVAEGNTGTSDAVFTLSLSVPSSREVRVDFATTDGTATAGSDYIARAGSRTFAPGVTTQTVTVPIVGDTSPEPGETFSLILIDPVNAMLIGGSALGTITNDDAPAPTVSAVSPTCGPRNGGLAVTITGTGFASGATVTFGETAANGVTVLSATTITATAPSRSSTGAVNVTVTNSDGKSATLPTGFTYTHRGDANGDCGLTVADVFYLVNHLFAGGPPPVANADANGDGSVTVADVFYLVNFLFAGGPPPV